MKNLPFYDPPKIQGFPDFLMDYSLSIRHLKTSDPKQYQRKIDYLQASLQNPKKGMFAKYFATLNQN